MGKTCQKYEKPTKEKRLPVGMSRSVISGTPSPRLFDNRLMAYSSARQTEIEKMEAEVKRLARQRDGGDSDEERDVKKAKKRSQLDEELAKYAKGRGVHRKGHNKDESNVLAMLAGFRSKLQTSATTKNDEDADRELGDAPGDIGKQVIEGESGIELDKDRGFMGHLLRFPKGNDEEVQKAEREYEVIDPRARGAQARQEERDRRQATRTRGRRR